MRHPRSRQGLSPNTHPIAQVPQDLLEGSQLESGGMACKAKAQEGGGLGGDLGRGLVPGVNGKAPSELSHTPIFLPQEVRRPVSMRLNIVSPDMPGELSPGVSGVRG